MAEDEGEQRGMAHPAQPEEERPQTAMRDSPQNVGFGADDSNNLSPEKEEFNNSIFKNAKAHAQNSRLPSLDPMSLPAGESSLFYNQSGNRGLEHGSDALANSLDEGELQRHLNNVESSFMPVLSPVANVGNNGVDDTYLVDGAQNSRQASNREVFTLGKSRQATQNQDVTPEISRPTTPSTAKAAVNGDDSSHNESAMANTTNTTSDLETMSSPTAAAAARTISRAISMASAGGFDEGNMSDIQPQEPSDDEVDYEATPRKPRDNSLLNFSDDSISHGISNLYSNAGNTPGMGLLSRKHSGKQTKFLRSRHSQHSSVSSFVTNPESHDGSEMTLGADYALQSGGAVPSGISRASSMVLSGSISLGSIASGIEDFSESLESGPGGNPETLTEEAQNRERRVIQGHSPPETPRPAGRTTMAAPTDTIIARHVRNVQVPESLAKEYRNKSGVSSPNKKSAFAASSLGRNGKNLTLKEQSSTIERLSKENFDLKLKVMFLSDRLDKLSEEGVREMISENVELKTGLAVMQRDNKALKRKVKELEKQLKDDEDRPSTAVSETSAGDPSPKWFNHEGAQEREEELIYLRERVEEYVTEIEKLRNDSVARENEKRNLTDIVRSMGERRGQDLDTREEMDVWKDLLEQETARREQADEDNRKLREEVFQLKTETTSAAGMSELNHNTNIYNITKKRQLSPSRPRSEMSDSQNDRNGAFSATSTLVEDLRRDREQLRHENAELRREVGAQTSMLTSRNREKERLYQEIEELKLARRGGHSIAGDSILDRSASRAHARSLSRASAGTRGTSITDDEKEELENKNAEQRDQINSLKIRNQDLEREFESLSLDFEDTLEAKALVETRVADLENNLEISEGDLQTIQAERDEALLAREQERESEELRFQALRQEAQEELDHYANEAEELNAEVERLTIEVENKDENFNSLQNEMRGMSESLLRLEDDHVLKARRISELESEVEEANRELEEMEQNLVEANGKVSRLSVQQESSQGEIAFLREEQDGDKIKIGDLEAAVRNTDQSLQDERERTRELEDQLAIERHQREVVAGKEKEEVQQYINDLNRQTSAAKDEARRLRKTASSNQIEAAEWKQRLMELEGNLRHALGDLNGTRQSLLNSINKLQRELEDTVRELDATKESLSEKERLVRQRDALLESHALESRKLADLLDKERGLHRNTKHQFETFQKTTQHTTRTLTQQESRVLELETSRQQDRRKITVLENSFKDQMNERNALLLTLWDRLSTICGTDWTHNNSLINGRALPSLEAVSTMLPGFSKNLLAAIRTIESIVGDFKTRVRSLEKDLWKEYQILESNLEARTKRLDRIETIARSAVPGVSGDGRLEISRLREAMKILKTENASLRAAQDVRNGIYNDTSPSPSVPTGPRNKITEKSRTSTLTRTSSSATETFGHQKSMSNGTSGTPTKSSGTGIDGEVYTPDLRWQIRLQELEYKLKAEREARKTDRSSARQRLQEASRENAELVAEVERNKIRAQMGHH